ncbi:glucuronate isomerase [Microbacterium sp. SLBN-154]|uniref:glucuronate isomerase n=1 Tax=Microbacterium sp. SLBN-154 TaxID=2768458 RepID=UPI00114EE20D|nr:glucuronate isomerase [Microbacterium sp. SLBN-154]TQK20689.1 glucuronate isomerase [Microbacterium sp. SLBN-154]
MTLTSVSTGRLLPSDPATRRVAEELYRLMADLPILSPHGHVDPGMLATDRPFRDPATLLIRDDHYVTRLLHADGVDLASLAIGQEEISDSEAREIWRLFCERWHLFAGTASGYWLRSTLEDVFGMERLPGDGDPDTLFDALSEALSADDMRPRALLERFDIEVLATTDDPLDPLHAHQALAADPDVRTVVRPTFRPDAYLDPTGAGWNDRVERLVATVDRDGYQGYLDGLRESRRRFVAQGATSADFGVLSAVTAEIDPSHAAALFDRARKGELSSGEAELFRAHMLFESARMSTEDGLVMTIHAGVFRNHHSPTFDAFGPDRGHDLPVATRFVEPLRPLLQRFGTAEGFHLVLFTVDETTFSRELAPLAGFYPSVFIGAPWWFLDAPDSAARFRAATVETAGFYRGSGFIDDTRAFLSIPARHDMARRTDAAYLARLVSEQRLRIAEAERIAVDLHDAIPRRAFKL